MRTVSSMNTEVFMRLVSLRSQLICKVVSQRLVLIALSVSFVFACGRGDVSEEASQTPEGQVEVVPTPAETASVLPTEDTIGAETEYRLPSGCTLTGHRIWDTGNGGGECAALVCGGTFIDSVDVVFGVYQVGYDSLVYNEIDDGVAGAIILRTGGTEVMLSSLLPYLDDWFSQAVVYGTSLVYWGLSGPGESMRRYAMRYRFPTAELDSLFLDETVMLTGYKAHLDWPRRDGGDYNFEEYRVRGDTWQIAGRK